MATSGPVLSPRQRQPGGCCAAAVEPDLSPQRADRFAVVAKALADPTRLRIVDAVRKAAPAALCQCELVPLFDMSQPAVLRHLRVLVDAGILGTERRGAWRYYFARPEALEELTTWMT